MNSEIVSWKLFHENTISINVSNKANMKGEDEKQ